MNFLDYARRHLDAFENCDATRNYSSSKAALRKLEEYSPHLQISDITRNGFVFYAAYLPGQASQQSRNHTKKYVCNPDALLCSDERGK